MNRKYRKTVIAGNWKMNMLPSEIKGFAEELKSFVSKPKWCDVVICAPAVMIPGAVKAFKESRVGVGAQDLSPCIGGLYRRGFRAPTDKRRGEVCHYRPFGAPCKPWGDRCSGS